MGVEKALLTSPSEKKNEWIAGIKQSSTQHQQLGGKRWYVNGQSETRTNFFRGVRLELAQLLPSGDYNPEFLLFYNKTFTQGKGWTFRAWELRQGEIGWKSLFVSDVWAAVRYKPGFQHFVDHSNSWFPKVYCGMFNLLKPLTY